MNAIHARADNSNKNCPLLAAHPKFTARVEHRPGASREDIGCDDRHGHPLRQALERTPLKKWARKTLALIRPIKAVTISIITHAPCTRPRKEPNDVAPRTVKKI